MRLKPWIIWTVVVICLLSVLVGLTLTVIAIFQDSGPGGLMRTGLLMIACPLFFLLGWGQNVALARDNVKLASRRGRRLIWGIVLLLVLGTVLFVVWTLSLERQ